MNTENLRLNIKYALLANHDHTWYEIKTKNEYAIWIIQEGTVHIEYNKTRYVLQPGDVFLFYPHVLYHSSSPSEACRFYFIHFDAVLGNNLLALHFYPFDGFYAGEQIKQELENIYSSLTAIQKREPFSELHLNGSLTFFLANAMKLKYETIDTSAVTTKKSAMAKLQPALTYIGHHLQDPIYIQDLAASVNLSEKYFITFFKQTMGITPTGYIIQAKMKKALEYLHEQKYSMKEVATLVGYSDAYTFSKAFKKTFGVAPSKI